MKGLLWKEWYQLVAQGKTILLGAAVMFTASAVMLAHGEGYPGFLVYACFLLGIFPMTLFAYDESAGWVEYSYAFPVRKAQLTGVKYLLGLLCTLLGTVCSGIILAAFGGWLNRDYIALLLVESICAPLLTNAGLLLLSFRFGSTKARYLYFIIVALFAGLLGFSVSSDDELGHAMAGAPLPILLGVVALLLVLYAASWRLSTVWYGKSRN